MDPAKLPPVMASGKALSIAASRRPEKVTLLRLGAVVEDWTARQCDELESVPEPELAGSKRDVR